jgi:hypothetical protein
LGVIQLADDARVPVVGEQGEFFCDVYLVHLINCIDARG